MKTGINAKALLEDGAARAQSIPTNLTITSGTPGPYQASGTITTPAVPYWWMARLRWDTWPAPGRQPDIHVRGQ